LVSAADVTSLIAAFKKRAQGEIVVPRVQGQRGNPIVFSGKVMGDILAQGRSVYCRQYMDNHPELISFFDTNNAHFVTDVDTLEDVQAFEKKWGYRLELPAPVDSAHDALHANQSGDSPEPAYLALRRQMAVS
jgi:molybdenum cofactor cytidylyltransferase